MNLKKSKYFYDEEVSEILINKEDKNSIIKEEEIGKISNFMVDCTLNDKINNISLTGKCFIDQNFIFYFRDEMKDKIQYFNNKYYTFPLLSITNCETNSGHFDPSKYCKEIYLKDNRNFVLKFSAKSFEEFNEIVEKFALPRKNESYFICAYYFKKLPKNQKQKNIKIYDLIEEFKRQNIDFSTNKQFRILNNNNFQFCGTYPKRLIVPYDMSNEQLEQSAKFRTKNRLPTLTYRYKNGNCIWRSSQTKSGFKGVNNYDQLLLSYISNFQKLYVFDARPKLNALANKFTGGGFENIDDYKNINMDLIFCDIPNIHVVRNSYNKLLKTVSYNTNSEKTLFMNIANSGWYETILIILKSSFQIYKCILENNNVLIHCSDGWDRTSQLCSLTQILLDKYYRTLDGFICLIEKDWMSFGHQFRYRNGFYFQMDSGKNESQFSPIFLQWLDALYQLMEQNYSKFQFNFNLILFIAEELYSGKYGTFLFNNDKEREIYDEENKTVSIWNYIKENENQFINNIYNPEDDGELLFNCKTIKLWKEYFYRFEKEDSRNYVLDEYERKLKDEKNIMEALAKFIAEKNNAKEIEELDLECQKFVKRFIKK